MLSVFSQDSIQDLIKKSRQNTANFNTFMNKSLNEVTKELNSKDKDMKLKALIKLIFFYLNYYDIQWASFNSIEVMSTGGPEGKRYSYLITQLQFKNNKDFMQLIPNQIRFDIKRGHNLNYINSALNFLNSTMNYQLANELLKDIESLLNINNNLIRKKVIVALTLASEQFAKVNNFAYWDDYLIKLITLLSQGTSPISNGISICIISSIQRMCKIAPKQCMTIFVELMNYFTKCEVNWNLIKIIDIFGMLFTSEPKFTKKKEFIKILSEQLVKTKSKSVEAQLVKLVMTHFDYKKNPNATELIQSSEERLKLLIFSQDNNLLVLSLRILKEIFENDKLSHSSHSYINDIFTLLNNNNNKKNGNAQILRECINILKLIVSKDNFIKICEDIMKIVPIIGKHAIDTIIDICSKDSYGIIETNDNLIWFIGAMFTIAYEQYGKESEEKVAFVIRDLSQRIVSLREMIVDKSVELFGRLIANSQSDMNDNSAKDKQKNSVVFIPVESNIIGDNNNDGGNDNSLDNKELKRDKGNNSTSLISVLLFIIGEYSNKDIGKIADIVYDGIISNEEVKKQYYVSLIYCLMKLIVKSIKTDTSNQIVSKDNYDKYTKIIYQGHDIESIEASTYFLSVLNNLIANNTESNNLLKTSFFNQEMKPLALNSHLIIKPSQSLDLTACLPINDKEIQITKKASTVKQEENKVTIDTTLYTPQLINNP